MDTIGGKAKWEYYFIAPHKTTKYIYNTTKENGDSAHLSFFSHLGSILNIKTRRRGKERGEEIEGQAKGVEREDDV